MHITNSGLQDSTFFHFALEKMGLGTSIGSSSSVCQKGKGWEVYELPIKPTLNEKSVFEIEKKGKILGKRGHKSANTQGHASPT